MIVGASQPRRHQPSAGVAQEALLHTCSRPTMSTFANAVFAESDDESDPDFVPEDASGRHAPCWSQSATYRIHLDASGEELETTKPDSIETEAQKAEKEK